MDKGATSRSTQVSKKFGSDCSFCLNMPPLYILSSFSKSLQFCIAVKTRFACSAPESLHLGVQCCSSTKSMQYQMTSIFKQKGLHVTVPLYIFIPHDEPTGEQCQWEGHVQGNMA